MATEPFLPMQEGSTSSLSRISLKKATVGPSEHPTIELKTSTRNPSRHVRMPSQKGEACKLFHASRSGRTDMLTQLDVNGSAVHQRDDQGNSALHHATRSNQVATLKMLLGLGADVNVQNEAGYTPVHLAARFNSSDVIGILLQHGADASISNTEKVTPLHSAARRGHEAIVRALLETWRSTVNVPDVSGMTPLHSACAKGQGSICKLLLDNGADVMATTANQKTPLHLAVLAGKVGIVEDLIKAVCQRSSHPEEYLERKDINGTCAIEFACFRGHDDILELLLCNGAAPKPTAEGGAPIPPLHVAAKYGYTKVLNLLVSRGSDVDARDDDLKTPLHGAATLNQLNIIGYLLDKGATIDAKDLQDQTPFLKAVKFGSKEAAELLLNKGADIQAVDVTLKNCIHLVVIYGHAQLGLLNLILQRDDGKLLRMTDADLRSPVHFAAENGDEEVLDNLLAKGFTADSADAAEKTPVHVAAENDAWGCVTSLVLANKQTLHMTDEHDRTALHLAAAKGYSKTCEVLFGLGASAILRDINRSTALHLAVATGSLPTVLTFLDSRRSNTIEDRDKQGNTALLLACQYGHVNIVQSLLDYGADVTARNDRKQTCLDVSIEWLTEEVAETLVQHERWREVMSNKDLDGRSPMEKLIQQLPKVAQIVLDRCITLINLPQSNPDLAITFDFEFLDPGPDAADSGGGFFGPSVMAEHKREELLNHAVTKSLLQWKWFSMGKMPFYLNFVTFQCFVIVMSVFISTERGKVSLYPRGTTSHHSNAAIIDKSSALTTAAPMLLFTFIVVHHAKLIFELIMHRLSVFKDLSTFVDVFLYVSSLVFLLPYITSDVDIYLEPSSTQWTAAIMVIFFMYLNEVLYIRRLQQIGIYVTMYFNVLATLLKVMSVFIVFIVGFALLYFVLLKEQDDFSNVGYSFVKTTVMMIGEMDYSDLLTDNVVNNKTVDGTDIPYVPLPTTTYVAFYVFCFTMPILLMNLLVGLAVGDIDSIQKSASLRNLIEEVDYVATAEKSLPRILRRGAYRKSFTLKPNQMNGFKKLVFYGTDIVNLQSYLESLMPSTSPAPKKDEEEEGGAGNQNYEERIASLENSMHAQERLLSAIAEKLQVDTE